MGMAAQAVRSAATAIRNAHCSIGFRTTRIKKK
jgi:hypothetical protein